MNKVHFSSRTNEWATPQDLFYELNKEFNFDLDPCASQENHKCKGWYGKEDDGLSKNWDGHTIFMNPPYGREIGKWIKKASETKKGVVVCLLPSRTDTKWFHDYIYYPMVLGDKSISFRFLKGRIKFGDSKNSAPFPSMIVIFNNK